MKVWTNIVRGARYCGMTGVFVLCGNVVWVLWRPVFVCDKTVYRDGRLTWGGRVGDMGLIGRTLLDWRILDNLRDWGDGGWGSAIGDISLTGMTCLDWVVTTDWELGLARNDMGLNTDESCAIGGYCKAECMGRGGMGLMSRIHRWTHAGRVTGVGGWDWE